MAEVEEKVEKTTKPRAPRAKKVEAEVKVEEVSVEKKVEKKPAVKKATKKAPKAQEFAGTGRRKCSIARVRVTTGTGSIKVNGQELKDYFNLDTLVTIVKQPLVLTETEGNVDVVASIIGGGKAGQAGALRHGIARALVEFRPELRAEIKKAGLLTRDARRKERKKYGLKKARRAPQFSKR